MNNERLAKGVPLARPYIILERMSMPAARLFLFTVYLLHP